VVHLPSVPRSRGISVNLRAAGTLLAKTGSEAKDWSHLILNFRKRKKMSKLISILVAVMFTVSSGMALAASHLGAQPMEKKEEMKKSDKKGEKKAKKAPKKDAKKDAMKKDEKK
jgi:hypothetical protein